MKQNQIGFTLIELMIAVAIIGILASIAIPSYQDSVKKSRRADAKSALLSLANAMERHFTETSSYCDVGGGGSGVVVTDCGDATVKDTGVPNGTELGYSIPTETASFYTVTINVVTPSSYTLKAAPAGAQVGDICGDLTLKHTGEKSPSTSGCW
jgi:type IV pilus assembly protein PilE